MMKCHVWLVLIFIASAGCSQSNSPGQQQTIAEERSSTKKQSDTNEREAGLAWERLVSKAKQQKAEARAAWQSRHEQGDVDIQFLRDDVKFDPARGVVIGEVQLNVMETTVASYKNRLPGGGYGKGIGVITDYTLRFRYASGAWQYMDGMRKNTDIHNRKELGQFSVSSLEDGRYCYLKTMFLP